MRIYITTHGLYEDNHISLCTTDFDFAIQHFIDYAKTGWYNSMGYIDCWENNKKVFSYGSMNYDIINNKKDITYEDIKNDILKQLK